MLLASPSRSMLFLALALRLERATVPDVATSPAKLKLSKLASTQQTRSQLVQALPLDEVLLSIQVLKSLPPMAQSLQLSMFRLIELLEPQPLSQIFSMARFAAALLPISFFGALSSPLPRS